MKGIGMGRGLKALGVSLAVGLGMTACSRDYTVGYLYVPSAGSALINAYAIDYQSGSITQLADSPIPASDKTTANPVTLVASPNGKNIYVINHDVSQVVQFAVGTDGKLYAQATTGVVSANGLTGTFSTAAAIDPAGAFLYVTFTFQNGYTTVRPGPGGIAVFPINSSTGALGTPLTNTTVGTTSANPLPYIPVGLNPTAIAISPKGGSVFVVDQEKTSGGNPFGVLLAFSQNTTTGVLSALPPVTNIATGTAGTGTTALLGSAAGTAPAGVAIEPTGRFIYVTDQATNQLYAYRLTNNVVTALTSSPFTTGLFPQGITIDPRGSFIYVANYGSSTVSLFTIDTATGSLSGGGGTTVATGPTCVTIEPALGKYLYTSNRIDNSVTGEQLDPHNGGLTQVQGNNFSAQALPSCAVTVANGAHATQLVQ